MSEIRITKSKYDNVINELINIRNVLEENISGLDDAVANLEDTQSGLAINEEVLNIQEARSNLDNYTNEQIANMVEVVESLTLAIENHLQPVNENSPVIIDTEEIKKSALQTIEQFSSGSESLKAVIEDSQEYEEKMQARHSELNDGILEAMLNPIDEMRQKEAENIFRSNETKMDNLNVYIAQELTFKDELDAIEGLIKTFDTFQDVFDPFIERLANISLYDTFMNNTIHVSSASSTIKAMKPVGYENDVNILETIIKKIVMSSDFYVEVLLDFVANMEWDNIGDRMLDVGIELYDKVKLSVDLPWLKAIPFGGADVMGIGIHLRGYLVGNFSGYELWKELAGDAGSIVGDKTGLVVGAGISELLFGTETAGLAGLAGALGGSIGGSMIGEASFEYLYNEFVIEDNDNTVHWIWED